MQYQLSIIIPTCNRHDTLIRAIDSVLYQGMDNIEVVVVNDGCNEIPISITEVYADYPFVTFIKNGGEKGAAGARNFGVKNAHGCYISFLDDDDIYLPGRLINVMRFIAENNYIFVSSGRFSEIGDFKSISHIKKQRYGVVKCHDNLYLNDIDIGFTMLREDFLTLNGFDVSLKSLEDWDFILRALRVKDGYKLERLDYVVNVDPNRPRVSNADSESYLQLATMYRTENGESWYAYMVAHGLSLSGTLSFNDMFKYSLITRTREPFIDYLRQLKGIMLKVKCIGTGIPK